MFFILSDFTRLTLLQSSYFPLSITWLFGCLELNLSQLVQRVVSTSTSYKTFFTYTLTHIRNKEYLFCTRYEEGGFRDIIKLDATGPMKFLS